MRNFSAISLALASSGTFAFAFGFHIFSMSPRKKWPLRLSTSTTFLPDLWTTSFCFSSTVGAPPSVFTKRSLALIFSSFGGFSLKTGSFSASAGGATSTATSPRTRTPRNHLPACCIETLLIWPVPCNPRRPRCAIRALRRGQPAPPRAVHSGARRASPVFVPGDLCVRRVTGSFGRGGPADASPVSGFDRSVTGPIVSSAPVFNAGRPPTPRARPPSHRWLPRM